MTEFGTVNKSELFWEIGNNSKTSQFKGKTFSLLEVSNELEILNGGSFLRLKMIGKRMRKVRLEIKNGLNWVESGRKLQTFTPLHPSVHFFSGQQGLVSLYPKRRVREFETALYRISYRMVASTRYLEVVGGSDGVSQCGLSEMEACGCGMKILDQ